MDPPDYNRKFAEEHSFGYPLISNGEAVIRQFGACRPVWESKFYVAFVLNRRVGLHAIDATPARWRGDAGSSPLDRARMAASSPRSAPDTLVDFHTEALFGRQTPTDLEDAQVDLFW